VVDQAYRGKTKEKRADERPIEDYLGNPIDKYIESHRPILARGKDPASALAGNGRKNQWPRVTPVGVITETSRTTLGIPVNPHIVSAAGVTTVAIHAGDKAHLGNALLHSHLVVAQESHNHASGSSASREYARSGSHFHPGNRNRLLKTKLL
jgi:hypothetical protein